MKRIPISILAILLLLAGASTGRAQLAITEIMSSSANTSNGVSLVPAGFQNSDFWELTNFGTNDVDLTGYTLTVYYDDNDGYIPRESFGSGTVLNNWAQVRDVNNYDVWYNSVPPLMSQPRAADYFTRRADFYERNSFFHCPAAKFPSGYASGNNPLFSISMNSKLIEAPATNLQASAIVLPSSTVMFLENLLAGEKPVDALQATTDLGQPSSYASRFVARHEGRGVLVFADGHSETLRGNEVVETRSGVYRGKAILPQDKITWTANPSDNPN